MADSGKQNPLGVNVLGEHLINRGLTINPIAASYMGSSNSNDNYNFGRLVQDTVLRLLTWSIHDGYNREKVTSATYNNLINISGRSSNQIHALGNSKPPSYQAKDNGGVWTTLAQKQLGVTAPANTGYPIEGNTDYGQAASWLPYNTSNPNDSITQWGYIRLHALQAHNEFNWNNENPTASPEYKEFLGSYLSSDAWLQSINEAILAIHNAENFLRGMYTSLDDLNTAEISGVSSAFGSFGDELLTLGNAIDFTMLDSFGLPSTLLRTLAKNNAITAELSLALLASGLTNKEISNISSGKVTGLSVDKERQIYGAFLAIRGDRSEGETSNLREVLSRLGVEPNRIKRTGFFDEGFESLADLLNVRKLFGYSLDTWRSLTVPIYSTNLDQPAKTLYPIFNNSGGINASLKSPSIKELVGNLSPSMTPPTRESSQSNPDLINSNLPTGFDSYLRGILPEDQAIAAGAFSYSMQQIKSIENSNLPEFGNIVRNLETINLGAQTPGTLPLLNQADVPTNQDARAEAKQKIAQGSGPYNTFTMSDLYGSMSGLPYNWRGIYRYIEELTTLKLSNIYKEMFLAVTWDPATFSVTQDNFWQTTQEYEAPETVENDPNPDYQPDPGQPNYDPNPYYNPVTDETTLSQFRYSTSGQPRISSGKYQLAISTTEGGGYGRGQAPKPEVDVFVRDPSNTSNCGGDDWVESGGVYQQCGTCSGIVNPSNPSGFGSEDRNDIPTFEPPKCQMGTNDKNAESLGGGSFGRLSWNNPNYNQVTWITNVVQEDWEDLTGQDTLNNPPKTPSGSPRSADWVDENLPLISLSVQRPPVERLPVTANGERSDDGQNTTGAIYNRRGECLTPPTGQDNPPEGWPEPMNSVVNSYIDQANDEISNIFSQGKFQVRSLNNSWNQLGHGLTREQRTRFTALGNVLIPKDYFVNPYPNTQITFVDSVPTFASDTKPHMNAQTLEAISDTNSLGGQSLIGLMRSERNQSRLQSAGLGIDNNLSSELNETDFKTLMINGTIQGITDGYPGPEENQDGTWTPPPWAGNDDPAEPGRPIIIAPRYRYEPPDIEPIDELPSEPGPPFPNPGEEPGAPNPGIEDGDVPPELDTRYTSGILMPSVASISQAIEQVIECNCDCWLE